MEDFTRRIKLSPEQRKEVERYLGDMTIMTEYGFLQLVRKIKQLEQKVEEHKYG